jgi:hypothetical protein
VAEQGKGSEMKGLPPGKPGVVRESYDVRSKSKGIWRDEVYKVLHGKEVLVENLGWQSNLIVVGMTKLLAGLMKNEPSFTGGILQHAQGRGLPSFDTVLPVPSFNSVQLTDEYFRKAPDSISYVDNAGNPSIPITNSILIRTTLDFNEANGVSGEFIREQGIYGGDATGVTNSGLLANLIFHKARFKDASVKIIRFIQFIF